MPIDIYLGDEDAQSLAERHFQVAAQCLIDMANHIIADEGLGSPDDVEGVLSCLNRVGAIPPELYERTQGLAGFRNILVHDYLAVDHHIVYQLLGRLDDLTDLAQALDVYARRSAGTTS